MFERFTPDARQVITRAQQAARDRFHDFIGTEHLLLGLEGTEAVEVLRAMDVELATLEAAVDGLIGRGERPPGGAPAFTARAKKALERSLRECLTRGDRAIEPRHILAALVEGGDGVAFQVLQEQGVTTARINTVLGWPRARPGWRQRLRSQIVPYGTTIGGDRVAVRASELAGQGETGSHHYLLAILDDERTLGAKVLAALGVTREAVEAKLGELEVVEVEVGGERFEISPEQADQIRRWLAGEGPPPLPA